MGHAVTIDFELINRVALGSSRAVVLQWLPGGRVEGHEYLALNPRRRDTRLGSFKINLETGKWADFATGEAGGDLISLAAFLSGCSQTEAATRVASMLGVQAT